MKDLDDIGTADFRDLIDQIDPVDIDVDGINNEAKSDATALVENLSKIYYDDKFMDENPRIKQRIETDLDSLRYLIKMRKADEITHDILVKAIGQNPGNASLYRSLTSIQSSSLSIQKQMDETIRALNSYLKNVQLEINFNTPTVQQEPVNTNTYRGSKDFIKDMLNKQSEIDFDN